MGFFIAKHFSFLFVSIPCKHYALCTIVYALNKRIFAPRIYGRRRVDTGIWCTRAQFEEH